MELGGSGKGFAGGEFAGGINRQALAILGSPTTDGVKVLQRETEWVDFAMALGAGGDFTVLL